MGGHCKCSLALVVLSLLNGFLDPCLGLDNVAGDDCALAVARKSIPFCYSALYDVNMKSRETLQLPRRTFCCCLHGLERCLRSAFAHFGCSSEHLIQEEFVNLVAMSLDNGDMIIDGPCEDYEDDVACQAEVSYFDSAVVTFTKVVPVRPDVLPESSRSSNRQPRLEPLNTTVNSSANKEEHLSHNGSSNSTGQVHHNCSSGTNTSCSRPPTDSDRSQRAYLEWESSKQLVVIVTDEHGERLVLTVNKKGAGYLVKTSQSDSDSGNDLLEWTEVTKVLGVSPTEGNTSTIIASNSKEDGTLYYGENFKDHGSIVPDKLMSVMLHYMNSTRNHTTSAEEENEKEPTVNHIKHQNVEDDPTMDHSRHPNVEEHFTHLGNRTPKFLLSVPEYRSARGYNFTDFLRTVNTSWYNMINSFSASSVNDTRNPKGEPETDLNKVHHGNSSTVEDSPLHVNVSDALNGSSAHEHKDHSRALFSEATLAPFPEHPSMVNITDPQEYQVMFFGVWPDNSSSVPAFQFPTFSLATNGSNALGNSSSVPAFNLPTFSLATNGSNPSVNQSRGARLSEESKEHHSCLGGNASLTSSNLNCSNSSADRIPKSFGDEVPEKNKAHDNHSLEANNKNSTSNSSEERKSRHTVPINYTSHSGQDYQHNITGNIQGPVIIVNSTSVNHSKEERQARNEPSFHNQSSEYENRTHINNNSEGYLNVTSNSPSVTKARESRNKQVLESNHTSGNNSEVHHNSTEREPRFTKPEHNTTGNQSLTEYRILFSGSNGTSGSDNHTNHNVTERKPKFEILDVSNFLSDASDEDRKARSESFASNHTLTYVNHTSHNTTEREPRNELLGNKTVPGNIKAHDNHSSEGNDTKVVHSTSNSSEERHSRHVVPVSNHTSHFGQNQHNTTEIKQGPEIIWVSSTVGNRSKEDRPARNEHSFHNTSEYENNAHLNNSERNQNITSNGTSVTEERKSRNKQVFESNHTSGNKSDVHHNGTEREPKFTKPERNTTGNQSLTEYRIIFSGSNGTSDSDNHTNHNATERKPKFEILDVSNFLSDTSDEDRKARSESFASNHTLTHVNDTSHNTTEREQKHELHGNNSRSDNISEVDLPLNSSRLHRSSEEHEGNHTRFSPRQPLNESSANSTSAIVVHRVSRRGAIWSRVSRLITSFFTLGEMDINL